MSTVTRLPKQHKKAPHCTSCGRDLPHPAGVTVDVCQHSDWEGVTLLAVTYHVRCACGTSWDLRSEIDRTGDGERA